MDCHVGDKAAAPAAAGASPVLPSMKRAAALRIKYSTREEPLHVPPDLLGMHPQNRHGVGLNGARCEELLCHVFRRWSDEEANHGAVAVQEKPGRGTFQEHNKEKVTGDPRLAPVTSLAMPYASLGSAHINQVLKNILGSALAESCVGAVDAQGRLQLALVEAADPGMAKACRAGLRWEILSYRLEEEEPDGVLCISAALNEAGSVQMLEHEMESIKHLAVLCSAETSAASVVCLESVRRRLLQGGSALADSSAFLPLLQFVVELGGAASGFIDELVCFHERFVNAKTRRLTVHHFREVCVLPSPRLRVALLKAAYGCQPATIKDGFIDYFWPRDLARLRDGDRADLAARADEHLRRFHVLYRERGVYRSFPPSETALLLGRFDMELGRVLLGKEGCAAESCAVDSVAARHDAQLRKRLPREILASLPAPLQGAAPAATPEAPAAASAPRLARFNASGDVIASDAPAAPKEDAVPLPWAAGLAAESAEVEAQRCGYFHHLLALARVLPQVTEEMLQVRAKGSVYSVVAVKDLRAGSVALLPLVRSPQYIVPTATHPACVPTYIECAGGSLFVNPCLKARGKSNGLAPAGSDEELWLPPFWAVRRSALPEECNCEVK
ncbi:MAG: hypothetical protein GY772_21325, partial [bacterium]|nr:hypothetical protein [bacterium]